MRRRAACSHLTLLSCTWAVGEVSVRGSADECSPASSTLRSCTASHWMVCRGCESRASKRSVSKPVWRLSRLSWRHWACSQQQQQQQQPAVAAEIPGLGLPPPGATWVGLTAGGMTTAAWPAAGVSGLQQGFQWPLAPEAAVPVMPAQGAAPAPQHGIAQHQQHLHLQQHKHQQEAAGQGIAGLQPAAGGLPELTDRFLELKVSEHAAR